MNSRRALLKSILNCLGAEELASKVSFIAFEDGVISREIIEAELQKLCLQDQFVFSEFTVIF